MAKRPPPPPTPAGDEDDDDEGEEGEEEEEGEEDEEDEEEESQAPPATESWGSDQGIGRGRARRRITRKTSYSSGDEEFWGQKHWDDSVGDSSWTVDSSAERGVLAESLDSGWTSGESELNEGSETSSSHASAARKREARKNRNVAHALHSRRRPVINDPFASSLAYNNQKTLDIPLASDGAAVGWTLASRPAPWRAAAHSRAVVTAVAEDSPAARAGVVPGMVVRYVEGTPVFWAHEVLAAVNRWRRRPRGVPAEVVQCDAEAAPAPTTQGDAEGSAHDDGVATLPATQTTLLVNEANSTPPPPHAAAGGPPAAEPDMAQPSNAAASTVPQDAVTTAATVTPAASSSAETGAGDEAVSKQQAGPSPTTRRVVVFDWAAWSGVSDGGRQVQVAPAAPDAAPAAAAAPTPGSTPLLRVTLQVNEAEDHANDTESDGDEGEEEEEGEEADKAAAGDARAKSPAPTPNEGAGKGKGKGPPPTPSPAAPPDAVTIDDDAAKKKRVVLKPVPKQVGRGYPRHQVPHTYAAAHAYIEERIARSKEVAAATEDSLTRIVAAMRKAEEKRAQAMAAMRTRNRLTGPRLVMYQSAGKKPAARGGEKGAKASTTARVATPQERCYLGMKDGGVVGVRAAGGAAGPVEGVADDGLEVVPARYRYREPSTGLGYNTAAAFRVIRSAAYTAQRYILSFVAGEGEDDLRALEDMTEDRIPRGRPPPLPGGMEVRFNEGDGIGTDTASSWHTLWMSFTKAYIEKRAEMKRRRRGMQRESDAGLATTSTPAAKRRKVG